MELRHLRYFLAVAEELHFARAAERLHIEQSPLSRAIRELEEELGAQLFVRTSRSTRLTLAGKLLMENAPRVLLALDQARESVKAAANGFHGRLRVALSDGITPSRLPALLARCREEDPEIEIRLFEVPLAQQLSGLRDDLYDAGFSMADEVGDGIIIEPAWEDELMVAMPARHELLAHRRVPLDEVLQHPLVLGDPAVCEGHAKQIDRILRKQDRAPLIDQYVATVVVMMTQYASQLERTRTGKTIVEAVPTQILLPNIRASAADYAMLGLSEKELDVLLGVGTASRLALVRDDRGSVVIDADLSALGPLVTVLGGMEKGEHLVGADYRDRPDFWKV